MLRKHLQNDRNQHSHRRQVLLWWPVRKPKIMQRKRIGNKLSVSLNNKWFKCIGRLRALGSDQEDFASMVQFVQTVMLLITEQSYFDQFSTLHTMCLFFLGIPLSRFSVLNFVLFFPIHRNNYMSFDQLYIVHVFYILSAKLLPFSDHLYVKLNILLSNIAFRYTLVARNVFESTSHPIIESTQCHGC